MRVETPRGLAIFTRRDCSLCEQMEVAVRQLLGPETRVEMIDIDEVPELLARYRNDVPVLCLDGEIVCKHYLDADRLQAAIAS